MIHSTHTNGPHAMTTQTTWSVCHAKTSCKCVVRIYIIRTTEGRSYLSHNRFVLLECTAPPASTLLLPTLLVLVLTDSEFLAFDWFVDDD